VSQRLPPPRSRQSLFAAHGAPHAKKIPSSLRQIEPAAHSESPTHVHSWSAAQCFPADAPAQSAGVLHSQYPPLHTAPRPLDVQSAEVAHCVHWRRATSQIGSSFDVQSAFVAHRPQRPDDGSQTENTSQSALEVQRGIHVLS
jgi:hypothetical protein